MKKIGMVVAVEIQSVMRKYADKLKREDVRGFKVYSVTFDDKILYITQSGAGEIRAAACTQLLISFFDVDLIVNYGVVGALTEELKVTNICLVEKVVHYDMDTSAADHCEVGRYLEYQDIYLPTTTKYVQLVKNHHPFIRPVICASGDKFIADETKKRALNHDFKADICDMESAAIVLICDQNNIPNLILKTVSDSITGGAAEFRSSIEKAADICLEILDDILKEL
ncbi:5'-methylthioadenosine/S-adenosylhomocysteine nucleosidase [Streptococcus gallolyticus subsp. gallolyticus]|jgi:adenosylhomocysteine nucleosidase|uniref:Adenosylhomocysteine nucleosidase n=1 Tax=Streptococcus gallolyticus TaxID=315405 RepID=A0A1I7H137_9STRE|nr:5'-methylthioadenosine/S-adenosylhomocysteine nucleosidase [Streptococcus gallolyticus]EFM29301.1 phosphorylase family [Streptococcus gallolyticus subsp. gallolyticus TX20005]MCO7177622.1 5'-methylthioadenosine/S-adenosylhomocysteine nucleosidase [Streptococcus gallolyticus]QKI00067.1 5'-methylthioadenosine/S-adenosylhomocysteine nucleosidase [Streptococcus gallolyticus]QWX86136.1 5'-methylthioadenosine/S-adenosylhomocysteine nucleosidase [Streptococcus gallolyticus subsp. gallolyticus TX200